MTKILIINGPNLNLLGSREKNFYGNTTIEKIKSLCEDQCKNYGMECVFFQSNHEGELIEKIQSVDKDFAGIIINPAAYTHTSIALLDALRALSKPKVEIHLSNIYAREEFRKKTITGEGMDGIISGFGISSYTLSIEAMKKLLG